MSKLVKLRDLLIYQDERYYCGPGPSAVQLPDGAIMVAFRRAFNWAPYGFYSHGWPSTEACLTTSADGGQSWSTPRIFTAGNITNQNLTRLADGTLVCLTQRAECVPLPLYERLKDSKWFFQDTTFGWVLASHGVQSMWSRDGGILWEGPSFLSPIPDVEPILPGWPSPAGLRASAIPLTDGTLGIAIYGHLGQEWTATNLWFMVSPDRGQTWQARGRIAHDPEARFYYNETCVYQCASSKLVAFLRVEKDPEHRLYTATSTDLGATWSPPRPENVRGHPYQAARLASGRVLLAYGYRYAPMGVRARLLDPECSDIAGAAEIVLRDDGGMMDLGYPHVLPLADGTALVSYYHNIGGGTRHIAASIVAEI
ncbi:MAG: exo-alpha-sialidase [Chloroflexi bacterium]|nr:exo-alpha-sialidase [Chloroflexota bacterium]